MTTIIAQTEDELNHAVRQSASIGGTVVWMGNQYHFVDGHEEYEIEWLLRTIKAGEHARTRRKIAVSRQPQKKPKKYANFPVSLRELYIK